MSVYTASTPTASSAISPAISAAVTTTTTTTALSTEATTITTATITTTTPTTTAATVTTTTSTTTAAAVAAAAAAAAPPITTTTTTTATSSTAAAASPETATGWIEFCERHARASASDFAKAFCAYVSLNLPESARANLSHRDFLRKFVESFCEHFENEYLRHSVRSPSLHDARSAAANERDINLASQNTTNVPVRASSHEEFSDYSEHEGEAVSPKPVHKPFFRRLSFKGLKKGKSLFHKQQSDEVELSHSEHRKDKHSKTKLSKIVVECRKEGIVSSMMLEHNSDIMHPWEKSRLALIKAISGYMLEFYSPPKTVKPRSGVFCSSIIEVRESTALEAPDNENTFVVKTTGPADFLIGTHDSNDMRSWIATIKYCTRVSRGFNPPSLSLSELIVDSLGHGNPLTIIGSDSDRLRANSASKTFRSASHEHSDDPQSNPPELPPRLRIRSSSNLELCSSQQEIEQGTPVNDEDPSTRLREYPWFHGTLPRSDAAQLVLRNAPNGHGMFLVRQSETRKGEFVLTFNFQGRAKHLRMTLNDQGQCRVQHLCFAGIVEMLEHFRNNAIPLETGGMSDVTLTDYVVVSNQPSGSGQQTAASTSSVQQQSQERRLPAAPEPREVRTYGGSIRTRVESLERLEQQNNIVEQQSSASSTGRAVQNTYSFL